MERGLLWLPLLAAFSWLAWAGWNEYQKLEAYQRWASQFDRYKYDIYAVLGQKGDRLTWGKPTRTVPANLQTASLSEVQQLRLNIDGHKFAVEDLNLPSKGKSISIDLLLQTGSTLNIPFTDIAIAANWYRYLSEQLNLLDG
jgi:hypothetical protein